MAQVRTSTKEIIENIHSIIKGYRFEEHNSLVRIKPIHIEHWIKQFEPKVRRPILLEIEKILNERYISRRRAKKILYDRILEMTKYFEFKNPRIFLKNSQFLNLQEPGKSQSDMLIILNEVLISKFKLTLDDCGSKSKNYSIYIDDVLCTGNTLVRDLKRWTSQPFNSRNSNLNAINKGMTTLVCCYIFIHTSNYTKKYYDMRHNISRAIADGHHMFYEIEVDNEIKSASRYECLLPIKIIASREIKKYQKRINKEVDSYLEDKSFQNVTEHFYRHEKRPTNETFFSNSKRRNLVENAFLLKGIEILSTANTKKENVRALGYALPSVRSFGFGTLCFTWRNVPNNTPLVFWYSVGSFRPLFKRNSP